MELTDPKFEENERFINGSWTPEDRKERASLEVLLADAIIAPHVDNATSAKEALELIKHFGDQLKNVWRWKEGRDWIANGNFASSHIHPNQYQERLAGALPFKTAC